MIMYITHSSSTNFSCTKIANIFASLRPVSNVVFTLIYFSYSFRQKYLYFWSLFFMYKFVSAQTKALEVFYTNERPSVVNIFIVSLS